WSGFCELGFEGRPRQTHANPLRTENLSAKIRIDSAAYSPRKGADSFHISYESYERRSPPFRCVRMRVSARDEAGGTCERTKKIRRRLVCDYCHARGLGLRRVHPEQDVLPHHL